MMPKYWHRLTPGVVHELKNRTSVSDAIPPQKTKTSWICQGNTPKSLLVANQSHDHSIQVEEKHQQVEAQLDKALFLVLRQRAEDLRGIQQVVFLHKLVHIVGQHWQVQQKHKPEAVHEEKHGQDAVDGSLRNEPRVQFMTQLNRVDVIALQIGVHDGEKHLRKQVHRIHNDGENK